MLFSTGTAAIYVVVTRAMGFGVVVGCGEGGGGERGESPDGGDSRAPMGDFSIVFPRGVKRDHVRRSRDRDNAREGE